MYGRSPRCCWRDRIQTRSPRPFPTSLIQPSDAPSTMPASGPGWVHEIETMATTCRCLCAKARYGYSLGAATIGPTASRMSRSRRGTLRAYAAVVDEEGDRAATEKWPVGFSGTLERDLKPAVLTASCSMRLICSTSMALICATRPARSGSVLTELLADAAGPVRFSGHVEADGAAIYENALPARIGRGCLKRTDGRYRSGRSHEWLKAICLHRDTFAIAGWARRMESLMASIWPAMEGRAHLR